MRRIVLGILLSCTLVCLVSCISNRPTEKSTAQLQKNNQKAEDFPEGIAPKQTSAFHALSDGEKERIVWDLFDKREFGKPEHKPICKELLATQGRFANANATGFTLRAIRLVEKQEWKDLRELVQRIYDRPDNIWLHEASFRCLRAFAGRPVPPDVVQNTQIIRNAGFWKSEVTDKQLNLAKQKLAASPDHEAVLVYSITVAAWHAGKGGTKRGRIVAAEVIKTIDKEKVLSAVKKLQNKKAPEVRSNEMNWLVEYLQLDVKTRE